MPLTLDGRPLSNTNRVNDLRADDLLPLVRPSEALPQDQNAHMTGGRLQELLGAGGGGGTPAPSLPLYSGPGTHTDGPMTQKAGSELDPNRRPDFRKVVAYESTTTPGYTTGRSTIADILATSALHTQVVVEFSQYGYGKTLEFVYDGAPRVGAASPGLLLPREFGSAATLPVMLVLPDSAAAARANIRPITGTQPTPPFILDEVGTYTLGGTEGFYRYKAPAGGTYAVPTGPDDANWHQVAPPVAGSARLQALTVAQARLLAADGDAVQPIDYVILRGALGNVTLRGIVSDAANNRPGRFSETGFWQDPAAAATAPAALVSYDLVADTFRPLRLSQGVLFNLPDIGQQVRISGDDVLHVVQEAPDGTSPVPLLNIGSGGIELPPGTRLVLTSTTGGGVANLNANAAGQLLVNGVPVTPADTFSVLTYAASIAIDFNAATVRTLAATGNVAFAASVNIALLKTKELYLTNTTGAAITLSFPAGWSFFPGPAPTSLAAGKQAVLTLRSLGTSDATIKAAYVAQA